MATIHSVLTPTGSDASATSGVDRLLDGYLIAGSSRAARGQQRFSLQANTILDPDRPLPATLDNFELHFRVDPSQADSGTRTG